MTDQGIASGALVDASWAQQHLDDPGVRFVEVDVDTTSYEQSHLPGAVAWNWTSQLSDGVRRDIATREDFSALLSESGIDPDTTIVLYGDNNNWFAAWAYWQLQLYGQHHLHILDMSDFLADGIVAQLPRRFTTKPPRPPRTHHVHPAGH